MVDVIAHGPRRAGRTRLGGARPATPPSPSARSSSPARPTRAPRWPTPAAWSPGSTGSANLLALAPDPVSDIAGAVVAIVTQVLGDAVGELPGLTTMAPPGKNPSYLGELNALTPAADVTYRLLAGDYQPGTDGSRLGKAFVGWAADTLLKDDTNDLIVPVASALGGHRMPAGGGTIVRSVPHTGFWRSPRGLRPPPGLAPRRLHHRHSAGPSHAEDRDPGQDAPGSDTYAGGRAGNTMGAGRDAHPSAAHPFRYATWGFFAGDAAPRPVAPASLAEATAVWDVGMSRRPISTPLT